MTKPPKKPLDPGEHIESRISDKQLELIGEVVANWSRLEGALDSAIWSFLKIDEEDGRTVTARLDARPKIEMLSRLGKRHISDARIKAKFESLLKEIGELQADRNFIVHGMWATIMPSGTPTALSLRPKADPWKVIGETFPAERMRWIIQQTKKFTQALNDLPGALVSSADKLPQQPVS